MTTVKTETFDDVENQKDNARHNVKIAFSDIVHDSFKGVANVNPSTRGRLTIEFWKHHKPNGRGLHKISLYEGLEKAKAALLKMGVKEQDITTVDHNHHINENGGSDLKQFSLFPFETGPGVEDVRKIEIYLPENFCNYLSADVRNSLIKSVASNMIQEPLERLRGIASYGEPRPSEALGKQLEKLLMEKAERLVSDSIAPGRGR